MKQFFTLVLVIACVSSFAQTTIPNAGFETWTSQGSYENPDPWDSPNDVSSSLGIEVVEAESSIVYEGSYSAKISVKSSIAGALPGVLTLGDFSFSLLTMSATIDGGTPFTGRPERFSGWFQYEPQNNDECFFGAILLKENGSNFDTVGSAGFFSSQTLLNWTKFDTTFEYFSTDIPTHLNIILLPTDQDNPQVNSVVYVDDLQLSYASDINDYEVSNINIINDGSEIHFPSMQGLLNQIEIYTLDGRLVKQSYESETSVSIVDLNTGLYILRIQNDKGIFSAKFIR